MYLHVNEIHLTINGEEAFDIANAMMQQIKHMIRECESLRLRLRSTASVCTNPDWLLKAIAAVEGGNADTK